MKILLRIVVFYISIVKYVLKIKYKIIELVHIASFYFMMELKLGKAIANKEKHFFIYDIDNYVLRAIINSESIDLLSKFEELDIELHSHVQHYNFKSSIRFNIGDIDTDNSKKTIEAIKANLKMLESY